MRLQVCMFCKRTVIGDDGARTEDYGLGGNGKFVCKRCRDALEFSLGH